MFDELSKVDIQKIKDEIEEKSKILRPKILEDLKTALGFGDLSENYEYKAAKQELRRCDSRLRYLNRMLSTAKIIPDRQAVADEVELFDTVELYYEEDDETEEIRLMTTLRQDALSGIISKESPLGKAILGHKVGARVTVHVSDNVEYVVVIRAVKKGTDDDSLPIAKF